VVGVSVSVVVMVVPVVLLAGLDIVEHIFRGHFREASGMKRLQGFLDGDPLFLCRGEADPRLSEHQERVGPHLDKEHCIDTGV